MFPSPSLTAKILSVNLITLMIVVIGVLYIGEYQKDLIASEEQSLLNETRLFARAMEETVISSRTLAPSDRLAQGAREDADFILDRARRLVDTLADSLADNNDSRIRLYSAQKNILADSRLRGIKTGDDRNAGGDVIEIEPLRPLTPDDAPDAPLFSSARTALRDAVSKLPLAAELAKIPAGYDLRGEGTDLPIVLAALNGSGSAAAWQGDAHSIILAASAPIADNNGIIRGALLITRQATGITHSITDVRIALLGISGLALLITLLLSLYLAWAIGVPLKRLGEAAKRIRQGHQVAEIPVYKDRKDEIGALSIALKDMTKALGDRLDTIERFAGDVSHELKNPLSSMKSAMETLERKIEKRGDADPNIAKLMEVLLHDIDRMNRLITDIARTSRLDVALEREGRSVVDMLELLRGIVDLQSQFKDDVHIRLKRFVDAEFTIRGNADRLAQVFQNLIDNAVSFSGDGDQVRIEMTRDSGWIVITVSDHGPGIPPDKIEAIFDRFYSERPGHEDYGEHSGLGLAIARQIVESHQGDIRAENIIADGDIKGAQFIVRLPAA